MTESFLILLAGGVMLAAFISSPRDVTVNWLRLAGIIAMALTALAAFFFSRRDQRTDREWLLFGLIFGGILLFIGGTNLPKARSGRPFALGAAFGAVLMGERLAMGHGSGVALISAIGIAA